MTSKTFKSSRPTGTLLRVDSTEVFSEAHLTIVLRSREEDICIAPSDAPALALAILEAAGVDAKSHESATVPYGTLAHLGMIASHLKAYAEAKSMNDAEAKELAELEAEALKLINAYRDAMGFKPCDWDAVEESDRNIWLAVARKAREMRAEK